MSKHFSHTTDSDVPVEAVFAVLSGADWSSHLAAEPRDDSRARPRGDGGAGRRFSINDSEVELLARYAMIIEKHSFPPLVFLL